MSEDDSPLTALFLNFAILSFFAIGGVNAAIPEMHRQAVDVHGWMTNQRFADLFAIAQAAPGPNAILVTLIGWDVAGVPGALAATLAMIGPASVLPSSPGASATDSAMRAGGSPFRRASRRSRSGSWRRVLMCSPAPQTPASSRWRSRSRPPPRSI
jgi:Chromate transporter